MTHAFAKLLAAGAAAAFLAVSPVSAQTGTSGQSVSPGSSDVLSVEELDQRVTTELRSTMGTTFRGLTLPEAIDPAFDVTVGVTVPETAVRHPLPAEVLAAVPDARGYEYFVLDDGRIALVHPEDRTIAMILD